MTVRTTRVVPGRYYDSVKLMRVSERLQSGAGVLSASAVMGTEMNLRLLTAEGFELIGATSQDLVVAVAAENRAQTDSVLLGLDALLASRSPSSPGRESPVIRSLSTATRMHPDANLVVVAVPGEYAAVEAWTALREGANVFIFSDNVPLRDEVRLKKAAAELGLLVMGPDCGTAILDGIGLGFANRVRRGRVGLVGASGTGIQQVASLVHVGGGGLAAAIGTGSRDLSWEVGGIMTKIAIDRLAADPSVERIGLISKPGDAGVAGEVLDHLGSCGKPAVACLLGHASTRTDLEVVPTLAGAARALLGEVERGISEWSPEGVQNAKSGKPLVAFYCGGTLCEESKRLAAQFYSQVPVRFIDVGADEYTRGRAHPMIDPRLRASLVATAGDEADVLLFDVLLGDLCHPDPAGAVLPAVASARDRASSRGVELRVFSVVVGTDLDPQGLDQQRNALEAAGVTVSNSNEQAACWAFAAAVGAGG